jgi:DNA-binding beta-propeller fold protein YncE
VSGFRIAAGIATLALAIGRAEAVTLVGVSFEDGLVYRVDPTTGAASSPRAIDFAHPCESGTCVDVLNRFAGVEVDADGTMLLAPVEAAALFGSHLVQLADVAAVHASSAAPLGQQVGEGDLALDPASGDLYALGLTNLIAPFTLLRIEPGANGWEDPTATIVGEIGTTDVSGLAFDEAGDLYALDTDLDRLLLLDPTDASTVTSVALSEPLGPLAGMDFDPATGTLWVADGGSGGQDALFTLDPATGALAEVGPLGLESGLSGLAVPEPDAAALGTAAAVALAARGRARR